MYREEILSFSVVFRQYFTVIVIFPTIPGSSLPVAPKRMKSKNGWVLLIMLLSGIVLGGFIGMLTASVSGLGWLNYGQSFGSDESAQNNSRQQHNQKHPAIFRLHNPSIFCILTGIFPITVYIIFINWKHIFFPGSYSQKSADGERRRRPVPLR